MKKKLLALLVVAVMLVIAACGNGNGGDTAPADTNGGDVAVADNGDDAGGDDAGDADDAGAVADDSDMSHAMRVLTQDGPFEINALIVTNEMAPNPGNRIAALMEERLGVTINYEIVTGSEQQDTRIGTLLMSGEFPCLMVSTDLEFRLIEGGAFLKLDDMIFSGNFPNIERHVTPFRQAMSYQGPYADHGVYILPAFNRWYGDVVDPNYGGPGIWIQMSVLSWHGYPDVSGITLEEYFDLIESYIDYHQTDENGTPLVGFTFPSQGRSWGMTNPPLHLAGQPNFGGVMVDFDTNEAMIYAHSTYAERYWRLVNEAWHRGLMEPETFVRPDEQWSEFLAQGNVLGFHDQGWATNNARLSLENEGRYSRRWVALEPTFDGHTPWFRDRPALNSNQGFGISSTADNPERLMAFLEVMMSQEWQIILAWGEEGIDFHVDADGVFYRDEDQRAVADDLAWRADNRLMALHNQLPKIQGYFPDPGFGYGNVWTPGAQPGEWRATLSDWDANFLEQYGKNFWSDFLTSPPPNPVFYPTWNIPLGDGSPAQLFDRMLADLQMEWIPRLVQADPAEFDNLWADFYAAVEAIPHQQDYIDVINAGIQQRIDLWGLDSRDIVNNR